MPILRTDSHFARFTTATLAATLLCALSGCGGRSTPNRTAVNPADFATVDDIGNAVVLETPEIREISITDAAAVRTPPGLAVGSTDSDLIYNDGLEPGQRILIDAKLGDVNGVPVFARDWFRPIGARLRAESADMPLGEWQLFAQNTIASRLRDELREELLLSEVRSSLTQAQQAGLLAFLRDIEDQQIRANRGSRALADEQLREANDTTLDGYLRDRERVVLLRQAFRQKILDRVQVTFRDIRRFHERNDELFNPTPRAFVRRIRVRLSDEESLAEVERRLAAGEPFSEVMQIEGNRDAWADDDETIIDEFSRDLETGSIADAEFYAVDEFNDAIKALKPGEWAGPIDRGSSRNWFELNRIEGETISLYDAQLEIEDRLFDIELAEEEQRYVAALVRRAGLDEFERLVNRLTEVAEVWYYRPVDDESDPG